jgi:glycosyltransferase involved in cell wall biosynthesis
MTEHQAGGGSKPLISVVVPCFNDQEVVPLTHARLIEVLGSRIDIDLEIVYIDDGSVDDTLATLNNLADRESRAVVVSFTRNFGHQAAVTAGLQYANGDAVVVIDSDLQDPPEVIPAMLDKWREGYEIVYGIRASRQEGWFKRAAYTVFYRLIRSASQIDIPLDSGDFALIDRKAVDALNMLPERTRYVRGLRAWIGYRQIGIPYERPARAAGQSSYTVLKMARLAIDGITSFTSKPLTIIFYLGVLSSISSVLGFIFYLVLNLTGVRVYGLSAQDVPGFTSIVLLLFLLSGIQLISIGVIGEYIARIYDEAKGRPLFLSRDVKDTRIARTSGRRK